MMLKFKKRAVWVGAAVLTVLIVALFLFPSKPIPVKAVELRSGEFSVVINATTTSTVKSEYQAALSAQRMGRVVRLPVKEGDVVSKGQVVAELDLTEEEVRAQSNLGQARATFVEAEKNLKRMEGLFAEGIVAQQDLDAARRAFDVASSQYEAALKEVKVLGEYTVIRAPFAGIIASKKTELGELLVPGREIVTIVDPDRIYVLATIDEVDVGRLRLGQPVRITVDAFPGEDFSGKVRRISPIVSGGKLETRTADVWIYFDKKDRRIKPGMSADIEILVDRLPSVLFVPTQSVIVRDGKKQVYVAVGSRLNRGSVATARLRPIEEGISNWSFTEIKAGLSEGEYVITTPDAEGLEDGARIKIE